MNYLAKRILLCVGLMIIYWGMLFRYREATEAFLQVLGAIYLGFKMFDICAWLAPKTT